MGNSKYAGDTTGRIGGVLAWIAIAALTALFLAAYIPHFFFE